jgi:hypothetical protein
VPADRPGLGGDPADHEQNNDDRNRDDGEQDKRCGSSSGHVTAEPADDGMTTVATIVATTTGPAMVSVAARNQTAPMISRTKPTRSQAVRPMSLSHLGAAKVLPGACSSSCEDRSRGRLAVRDGEAAPWLGFGAAPVCGHRNARSRAPP